MGVQHADHVTESLERRHGLIGPTPGFLQTVQVQAIQIGRLEFRVQVLQSTACQSAREFGQFERFPEAFLRSHFPQNSNIDRVVGTIFHTLNLPSGATQHNTAVCCMTSVFSEQLRV